MCASRGDPDSQCELDVDSLKENFLLCIICAEQYRNPKVLPCLHSFCEVCLQTYLKKKGHQPGQNSLCPICQQKFQLPSDGVKGLKTNFMLNSLQGFVEQVAKSSKKGSFCTICPNKEVLAVSQCLDCEDSLCKTCAEFHCRTKLTAHHLVLTFEEIKQGEEATIKQMASRRIKMCPKHSDEKLKFYCKSCCAVICGDCKVLEHDTHPCTSVQDAAKECEKHMTELAGKLDKLLKKEQEKHNAVKALEISLAENFTTVKESIQKAADRLVNDINTAGKLLQDEALSTYAENKKQMDAEITKLSEKLSQLKSTENFVKLMLSSGSSIEKLEVSKQIREQLKLHKAGQSTSTTPRTEVKLLEFKKSENYWSFGRLSTMSEAGYKAGGSENSASK